MISPNSTSQSSVTSLCGVSGFDPSQKQDDGRSHVGIENVRARLEMLCGGTLIIDSVPDKGTTAVVTLPKRRTA